MYLLNIFWVNISPCQTIIMVHWPSVSIKSWSFLRFRSGQIITMRRGRGMLILWYYSRLFYGCLLQSNANYNLKLFAINLVI